MDKLYISEFLEVIDGKLLCGNPQQEISSVSTSSRNIEIGALFVPIKGEKVDAHDFIKDAFSKGAAATLTEYKDNIICNNKTYIYVENTRAALQKLAAYYRRRFDIPVIGVTGSVGKTTTKEMIASALSIGLNVMKTEENYNSQIGLPLTIFKMDSKDDIAILEMGISEFGEMSKLAQIATPTRAVITNIGITHIENLKSKKNILKEKLHIIDYFNEKSTLFLNGNDKMLADLKGNIVKICGLKTAPRIIYFGTEDFCEYKAEDIESDGENTTFILNYPKGKEKITIPAIGIHNVNNALAAIAVSIDVGLDISKIKLGLNSYKSISMRQQIHHVGDVIIIDDSYNSSPESVKGAINVLKEIRSKGKSIAILADMLELGSHSKRAHHDVGEYAAKNDVEVVVTIGENAKEIAKGVREIRPHTNIKVCNSNKEAEDYVLSIVGSEDKILVKGSRGMHTDEIVKKLLSKILI